MQGTNLLNDPGFKKTLDQSPFQEGDLPGLSTAVADSFERMTPDQKTALREVVDELDNLPAEQLRSFLRMIDFVEKNPDQYPKFIEQLVAAKAVEPGELPAQYSPDLMAIIKTLIAQALNKAPEQESPEGFADGGIVSLKKSAQKVRDQGRRGDTMLAHINPLEAAMLKRMGGSGTINPKTGLPEFGFWDSTFGKVVKIGGQILGTVLLTPFVGPVAAGAIVGGVSSLITGGSAKDALKSALFGGITGGLGAGFNSMLGGGEFLEGALKGGSLFGGMFGGASAAGAGAGGAGASAEGAAPPTGPVPPVRPAQETIDALQGGNFPNAPTVPVAAAKANLFNDPKGFFSKAMTPEGIADIWKDYKVPIMLGGGAALIAASSGGTKTQRPGIVGPTGVQLLAKEPGKYGFDVTKFAQQETPANPPVFPGGGYIAPSVASAPIAPPQYGGFEYPTGIMAAKAGGHISGPGTGTSDSIPARLSDGEFVMTADAVRGAGNGSRMKGARKMYELMHKFERMA
jgi:hypothetical protein